MLLIVSLLKFLPERGRKLHHRRKPTFEVLKSLIFQWQTYPCRVSRFDSHAITKSRLRCVARQKKKKNFLLLLISFFFSDCHLSLFLFVCFFVFVYSPPAHCLIFSIDLEPSESKFQNERSEFQSTGKRSPNSND